MRQLDLFGSLLENTPPDDEKKGKPAVQTDNVSAKKTEKKDETFTLEQYSLLQPDEVKKVVSEKSIEPVKPPATEPSATENKIFFTDGKIGVKVKSKTETTLTKPTVTELPKAEPETKKTADKSSPEKKQPVNKIVQKRGRKSYKDIDAEADLIELPDDEALFQKQYYPISEVAGWFKVNTSLLRFWENEFDILKPRKNRKGDRMFRPEDVKNIQLIYELLRQKKYSIEGAKEYLKSNKSKADANVMLSQTLTRLKNFLLDIKANLD